MDRRTTIQWVLAASACLPVLRESAWSAVQDTSITAFIPTVKGYGTDPKLLQDYKLGGLWPLTFTPAQRRTATILSDLIIPADEYSPSASQVGVVEFLDEWISAPYSLQRQDRKLILEGLHWLKKESERRFATSFATLNKNQRQAICNDICFVPKAKPEHAGAAKFFTRYRDLTAGGFYTTPQGRKDLKYMGNTPLLSFEGPPPEVLKQVGLIGSKS